jgi:hypothetical protein
MIDHGIVAYSVVVRYKKRKLTPWASLNYGNKLRGTMADDPRCTKQPTLMVALGRMVVVRA